ncbi:xylanase [Neptunitalea chrysea]|uniref:Xylanase n=1 Tax=Neptunitalea chrysea TaxID=1647581 RepID=A0A9W6B451_9FLAO|nr:glycoside hydrolase [Neptunitalea chrysea]GLB51240.1 xylanase [Neptunitalea chrysea]
MMKLRQLLWTLNMVFLFVFFSSCSSTGKTVNSSVNTEKTLLIEINATKEYQTIENFGASDAWSCQFVGNWPEVKKNAIADLLFSTDVDEIGNPKGIGLSLWRFNIGAGSTFQGNASGIGNVWRRAESFLLPDGTYDFTKQQGQLWFANAAKSRGVEQLLLFANSPPVNFTLNGKAYANDGGVCNITEEKLPDFANYLANVVEGMDAIGLHADYISPINEPQWDWSDGGQEGTPFYNSDIAKLTTLLNMAFEQRNINTKIDIAEAGQINYLFEVGNKPGRSNQINDFFDKGSKHYLGDLSHLSKTISGHSYFTTSPQTTLKDLRAQLHTKLITHKNLNYWMSEYCILGDNAGEIDGNGRDLGIRSALYLSKVIHYDLTTANASAWHWWLAISPYNYKDGLIYIDKNEVDGNFYESKMLWSFGNYSRFIRPGYKRISVAIESINNGILVSGYKSPNNNQVVIVITNPTLEKVAIDFNGLNTIYKPSNVYVTSENKNLEREDISGLRNKFGLAPNSISTFIFEINN